MMTYHVQFLLLVLAGWDNRQQQDVIDYQQEENRVLRGGLRGKRLRLSDDDRRRLAVKAQALGREVLAEIASVATSATLLRWYRRRTCISSKASEWLARVVLGLSITAFAATSAGEDLFSGDRNGDPYRGAAAAGADEHLGRDRGPYRAACHREPNGAVTLDTSWMAMCDICDTYT